MTSSSMDKITKVMDIFLNGKCLPVILFSKTISDFKDFLKDGVFIEPEKEDLEKQIQQLEYEYKKKLVAVADAVVLFNDIIKEIRSNEP